MQNRFQLLWRDMMSSYSSKMDELERNVLTLFTVKDMMKWIS